MIVHIRFNEFLKLEAEARCVLFRDTGKNPLCRKFLENAGVPAPEEQITADGGGVLRIPDSYRLPHGLTSTVTVRNREQLDRA